MRLDELCEAHGVSGDEGEVRRLIAGALGGSCEARRTDTMGNLFVRRPGKGPRMLVTAHMDEVGLMVTSIESSGYLRFRAVGGVEAGVLLAKPVVVGGERIAGVIGAKPVHLLRDGEGEKPVEIEDLFIDIGATGEEQACRNIRRGDYVSFATEYGELGGQRRTVKAKALDDRVGCYILARLLDEDWDLDLNAVFTVQEEVGLRGAMVAAAAVKPDLALVLEGTVCADLPGEGGRVQATRLGGGPAITLMDRTFLAHRGWVNLLVQVAEREGIPYQFKTPAFGGTEAGAIHLTREGVPCAVIAVPIRYIHAPVGIMSLDDMEHTLALARSALEEVAGSKTLGLGGKDNEGAGSGVDRGVWSVGA